MDLRTAADRLGVHYQTAYRWVRQGALRAVKVGTSYEVSEAELERFQAARLRPAPPPARANVRRWDQHVDRLYDALVSGDELAARHVVDRLHGAGVDVVEVCDHLLAPALVRVGEAWAAGTIDVATEHRAASIAERAVARIDSHPRGRPRGVAVVASAPTDDHALPSLMAAVALRSKRWQVHHVGANTPSQCMAKLVAREQATLVVLSLAYPPARREAERTARRLERETGARVLVGRPGATLAELVDAARSGGDRAQAG